MPAKRCPMCHTVNEDRDWRCRRCGYEFGQPIARVRELLRDQLTNAKIMLIVLVLVDLLGLALPVFLIIAGSPVIVWPSLLAVGFLVRATVKTGRKISISRTSLRSLDEQEKRSELPKATLRSG